MSHSKSFDKLIKANLRSRELQGDTLDRMVREDLFEEVPFELRPELWGTSHKNDQKKKFQEQKIATKERPEAVTSMMRKRKKVKVMYREQQQKKCEMRRVRLARTRASVDWSAMSGSLCFIPSVIGSHWKFPVEERYDLVDRLKASLCMLKRRGMAGEGGKSGWLSKWVMMDWSRMVVIRIKIN